jgi:hypothetical protein
MTEARRRKNDHFVSHIFDSSRATTPTPRLMSSRSSAFLSEHRSLTPSYASFKYHQPSSIFTSTSTLNTMRDLEAKHEFPSSTKSNKNSSFISKSFVYQDKDRAQFNNSYIDTSFDNIPSEDTTAQNVLRSTFVGNLERSASTNEIINNSIFKRQSSRSDSFYQDIDQDLNKSQLKENSFIHTESTECPVRSGYSSKQVTPRPETSKFSKSNTRLVRGRKEQGNVQIPPSKFFSCSSTPSSRQTSLPLNARQMKLRNLNVALPEKELPKPCDEKVVTLEVKGLRASDDEFSIKNMCTGYHILSVETDFDNLKGTCKGTAKIKVREMPNDKSVDDLKLNFMQKGIDVSLAKNIHGKKNHYSDTPNRDFLDKGLQIEEHRLGISSTTPKVSKMKNLESSDDLYGNSPGVGRWSNAWKLRPKTKDTILSKCLGALNWERLGKVSTTSSARRPVHETKLQASYMRSTLSYISKQK